MRQLLVTALVALAVGTGVSAYLMAEARSTATLPTATRAKAVMGIAPLPEEKIGWLFDQIHKKEKVEPAVLHAALIGPQLTLRADAARMLGEWGEATSVPYLIQALTDESTFVGSSVLKEGMSTVRYWANESLKTLTGQDQGFVWNDPIEKRNAAVLRWLAWYQTVRK